MIDKSIIFVMRALLISSLIKVLLFFHICEIVSINQHYELKYQNSIYQLKNYLQELGDGNDIGKFYDKAASDRLHKLKIALKSYRSLF